MASMDISGVGVSCPQKSGMLRECILSKHYAMMERISYEVGKRLSKEGMKFLRIEKLAV